MLPEMKTPRTQPPMDVCYRPGMNHIATASEAFGRNISLCASEHLTGMSDLALHYNPVSLAKRHITIKNIGEASRYLASGVTQAASAATRALDYINPVSIAIRKGPWFISKPLQFTRDELQALTSYLTHPIASGQELLEYFGKKPSRMAKLLKVMGVPVPAEAMAMMKFEEKLDTAEKLWHILMKEESDPEKMFDKNMARLRGKVVLTALKAMMGDNDEVFEDLEHLAVSMLETAGNRVLAKTIKYAVKDPV